MTGDSGPDHDGHAAFEGSSRQALSRERIVATAIEFVDRHGLAALTMRGLGKELGVEAMSLYRHVNGREDLLEGIVDRLVGHLHLRPDVGGAGPDRRLAGLPAVARPRRPVAGRRASEGLPADRDPASGRPLAAATAAQPARGRGVPDHPHRAGLQRRARRHGLPRLHQLPARAPASRGQRPRRTDRARGGAARRGRLRRPERRPGRGAEGIPPPATAGVDAVRGPRRARSSSARWRTCWTGSIGPSRRSDGVR